MDRRTAEKVLREVSRRSAASNLLDTAFPAQRRFIDDPAPLKAALCTRRSGKTYAAGLYLIKEAMAVPGCTCMYVGLTRDSSKRILFKDVLKVINRRLELGMRFNNSELSAQLPNGSVIYLIGLDSGPDERDKVLGQKFRLVIIDEAAFYKQDLREMVYGTLMPAVADYGGIICLISTPGDALDFFYQVTVGEEPGWSVHRWATPDNPHMAAQWAAVQAQTQEHVKETPRWRRDWLGEWVVDTSRLVYTHRTDRNLAESLPASREWFHVIGLDIGYNDDTAWVVCAYTLTDRVLYVVEAISQPQLIVSQVADFTQHLIDRYAPHTVVIDNSQKMAVEEMRQRFHLPLEAADKTGKYDAISMLNSDLTMGLVKVLPGARDLLKEWSELVWDEPSLRQGRHVEHQSKANHLSDAMLYAWRRCTNYSPIDRVVGVARGTEQAIDKWWERKAQAIQDRKDDERRYAENLWGEQQDFWGDEAA